MSLLHPEKVRRCKRCGHAWFAQEMPRWRATASPVAAGFTPHQQAAKRQTMHERRLAMHDRWARCAKCGSTKVKTVKRKMTRSKK